MRPNPTHDELTAAVRHANTLDTDDHLDLEGSWDFSTYTDDELTLTLSDLDQELDGLVHTEPENEEEDALFTRLYDVALLNFKSAEAEFERREAQ